nr:hypothetical protein [Tanacetum cinerariifolium]
MVRYMMSRSTLPISFWGYALGTVAHILNLVPTKKVSKTPFEMWKGKRSSLRHIKILGCDVYVRREAQYKLEARSKKCLFIGYQEESFGYLFYKPKDNVVFVARKEVFLDREMISKEESWKVVTPVKPDDISLPIRRTSGRVSKPPQFYYGFHIKEDKISDSTLSELDKPANYKEAMASPEAAKWKKAMKSEIQSMYENQMDVKTAFLNETLIEDVLMAQLEGFENEKSKDESCIYVKVSGSVVVFLVLYMDDILLIGNNITMLESVKDWLGKCFALEELGDAAYILGIKIYKDSKDLCLKIDEELDRMSRVLYALVVGSIMYAMMCTRPDVSFALSMVSRHQQNLSEGYWTAVKNILKYLRNTKDRFLVYGGEEELKVTGYCDANFTCGSEYIAACEASKEAIWMKNFIGDPGVVPTVLDPIEISVIMRV